ncbi:condensation domain-containing protein [Ramlibacter sp. PS4R-6]|uniref:condensation domain-containing protein n=1 Tax=Ramlibacter sp. PS4R-6 TaxID=3133438 RepID=UPI0030A4EB6D
MKPIDQLLASVAALDIKLWVEDGKLRVNAPQGAMTGELKSELSARKQELIEFLERGAQSAAPATLQKRAPDARVPLTHGQERIWTLARLEPGSSVYNVPTVFQLAGKLQVRALEQALGNVLRRHESLRTVFPGSSAADAHQEVLPHAPVVIPVMDAGRDLAKLPPQQAQRALHRLLRAEVAKPFDLERGPLWRARLLRLKPGEHVLVLTMHHIVFDGMSKAIFLDELAQEYRAAVEEKPSPLAEPELQFADYAVWQRARLDEATLQRQLDYWKQRLAGAVPPLATPNEKDRVPGKGKAGNLNFVIRPELTAQLAAFGQAERASLFVVLLAGLNLLLHGYTGQQDQVLAAPMASRERAEIERMVGYFNNIVAMRCDLQGNPTFRELVGRLRTLSLEAFDNQYVPLQHVAQLPNLARTPLTRGMFSFQDASSRKIDLPGLAARPMSVRKDAADFDFAVYTELEGDRITGVLDFNADIFSAERMKLLLQRFQDVLARAAADPDLRVADFPQFGRPLADIEKMLAEHPQIDQAVIERDASSGALNAWLVLNEHDVPSLDVVRAHARKLLPAYRMPASFIPVDEMPLAPDGSVNRSALPPPAKGRDSIATPYAEPRSDLERTLAAIWKQVLWLDFDVGIHDSFRELGGHSLLSVQMVVEIEKALGKPVPPRALATLNTVAQLAEALERGDSGDDAQGGSSAVLPNDIYQGLRSHTASWEGQRTSPDGVMVGLNTDGPKQALFWCLQRYQELQQLAKYLGPEQPVWGMRSGNRVMVKTQDNIELLAKHYVGEILQAQPQGPYLIGGNCQAALIAFQVARQLRALGHEITLLVMQEKFAPFAYDSPVALLFGDRSVYNPRRSYAKPEMGWHKFYTGPVAMTQIQGEHGQFFREPNVQILTATIKRSIEAAQAGALRDDPPRIASGQVLPEEAYRARVSAQAPQARAGERAVVRVEVTNESSVPWQPSARSGIHVANRWLRTDGGEPIELDGRAELVRELGPGQTATVELGVTVPAEGGRWVLEIDLVDEGVARFQERGSKPCLLEFTVDVPAVAGV